MSSKDPHLYVSMCIHVSTCTCTRTHTHTHTHKHIKSVGTSTILALLAPMRLLQAPIIKNSSKESHYYSPEDIQSNVMTALKRCSENDFEQQFQVWESQ
jgi:hypothetical protein